MSMKQRIEQQGAGSRELSGKPQGHNDPASEMTLPGIVRGAV